MRDIDIRKDVYALFVLSIGTTKSLLDAFHLGDQVDRELTIDGVNNAHYTGDFVYPNLVCFSYWHVKLDGMKFNVAAVKTIPHAIVDSGTAEPTVDVKFMAACCFCRPLSFGGLVTC